jgi:alpha-L-fucosidase 2
MNLSECDMPFFDLLERMRINGRVTAKKMYGCRGFVAHHNTDIWADTAPQDSCLSATYWVLGAVWMATHIFEHYLFTKDIIFLTDKFETMLEAAEFILDFMYEVDGKLVTSPSLSPENSFITEDGQTSSLCASPSMDFEIIWMLFNQCLKSAQILKVEQNNVIERIKAALPKLPTIQIGSDGRIMEWEKDYKEVEPGHRHMSHLFALYPSSQISVYKTPEYATAARKSLEYRLSHDGGATGWSRAWLINFWARLHDAQQVFENIQALLKNSSYINLLDKHPPFQIDGNFGGAAGIAEAILQSQDGEICLLPALPTMWGKGCAHGLRARGGITIDLSFDSDGLMDADLCADDDIDITLRIKNINPICTNENLHCINDELYKMKMKKNVTYHICREEL